MAKKESIFKKIVDIECPKYINSTTVMTLGGVDLTLPDVVKAALQARMNIGLGGDPGEGKSQLITDIRSWFGYNTGYLLGRNDMDIKALYRELKFTDLAQAMKNGGKVAQKDMVQMTAAITQPIVVVEEINRCLEMVQNQLFNVFEGFIEDHGVIYKLGKEKMYTFKDKNGEEIQKALRYSVGIWSANLGNGQFTGTVTMDNALKQRSHMIINVDNFLAGKEKPEDLDAILRASGAEVRLKEGDGKVDNTELFFDAFCALKQSDYTLPEDERIMEEIMFRYLIKGLDYVPIAAAKNSKKVMKEVWPGMIEENNPGSNDDDKLMYTIVYPASVRTGLCIMSFARSLRQYAKAKNPKISGAFMGSVMEAFKLVAPYSGMIANDHRIRQDFMGNYYLAGSTVAEIIKKKFSEKTMENMIQAIAYNRMNDKPMQKALYNRLQGEFECLRFGEEANE